MSVPGAAAVSVPAAILSTVPPSRLRDGQYNGVLFLGPFSPSAPAMLTAPGLDAGVLLPLVFSGKTVAFQ
jgi:hypothetical protein